VPREPGFTAAEVSRGFPKSINTRRVACAPLSRYGITHDDVGKLAELRARLRLSNPQKMMSREIARDRESSSDGKRSAMHLSFGETPELLAFKRFSLSLLSRSLLLLLLLLGGSSEEIARSQDRDYPKCSSSSSRERRKFRSLARTLPRVADLNVTSIATANRIFRSLAAMAAIMELPRGQHLITPMRMSMRRARATSAPESVTTRESRSVIPAAKFSKLNRSSIKCLSPDQLTFLIARR